jgi:hypothetical protein
LVEALCYKLEGRRFESRMSWIFSVDLSLPASNRNEYQESSWGVKSSWHVGLTTLPPSVSRMSDSFGASTSRNPKGLHGLYRDNFTFTISQKMEVLITTGVRTSYRGVSDCKRLKNKDLIWHKFLFNDICKLHYKSG